MFVEPSLTKTTRMSRFPVKFFELVFRKNTLAMIEYFNQLELTLFPDGKNTIGFKLPRN